MAKIALIVGSVRQGRQGIKVARWMEEKLKNRNHVVFFIDPLELNLPLLDKMYKEMTDPSEKMKSLQSKINDAEGYLAVTPEYNVGTFWCNEKYIRLLFRRIFFQAIGYCLLFPRNVWWDKCAQQLRLIFAELGAPSISSSFSIPRLHKVFNEDGKLIDEAYDKRVSKFLAEFEWYIKAFKTKEQRALHIRS